MKDFIGISVAAQHIKRTLGVRKAAGFLRNQGFTLNQALAILV